MQLHIEVAGSHTRKRENVWWKRGHHQQNGKFWGIGSIERKKQTNKQTKEKRRNKKRNKKKLEGKEERQKKRKLPV